MSMPSCGVVPRAWRQGSLRRPSTADPARPARLIRTAPRVQISNPDKVMFPAAGLTKRDVVAHYEPEIKKKRKRRDWAKESEEHAKGRRVDRRFH